MNTQETLISTQNNLIEKVSSLETGQQELSIGQQEIILRQNKMQIIEVFYRKRNNKNIANKKGNNDLEDEIY